MLYSAAGQLLGHAQLHLRLPGRRGARPRLFTAGQAGIFYALCYFASLFTQPVIGGWADRHPEVPLKRLLIVMLLPAIALNLVFYFTRPNFLLTALTFFLFGVLETNSYPLIDSMGMQYVNAGVQIPYSLSRGIGSLSYALLCVATGLLTARFGMQTALLAHCAEQLVMLVCLLLFPSIPAQLLPQPQKGAAEGPFRPADPARQPDLYAHADCLLLRHDGRDADQRLSSSRWSRAAAATAGRWGWRSF